MDQPLTYQVSSVYPLPAKRMPNHHSWLEQNDAMQTLPSVAAASWLGPCGRPPAWAVREGYSHSPPKGWGVSAPLVQIRPSTHRRDSACDLACSPPVVGRAGCVAAVAAPGLDSGWKSQGHLRSHGDLTSRITGALAPWRGRTSCRPCPIRAMGTWTYPSEWYTVTGVPMGATRGAAGGATGRATLGPESNTTPCATRMSRHGNTSGGCDTTLA